MAIQNWMSSLKPVALLTALSPFIVHGKLPN